MAQTVRHDDEFIRLVKVVAQAEDRSIPKQIEHWAKIGRIAEDNPELSYEFIRNALRSKAEADHGMVVPYTRLSAKDKS